MLDGQLVPYFGQPSKKVQHWFIIRLVFTKKTQYETIMLWVKHHMFHRLAGLGVKLARSLWNCIVTHVPHSFSYSKHQKVSMPFLYVSGQQRYKIETPANRPLSSSMKLNPVESNCRHKNPKLGSTFLKVWCWDCVFDDARMEFDTQSEYVTRKIIGYRAIADVL